MWKSYTSRKKWKLHLKTYLKKTRVLQKVEPLKNKCHSVMRKGELIFSCHLHQNKWSRIWEIILWVVVDRISWLHQRFRIIDRGRWIKVNTPIHITVNQWTVRNKNLFKESLNILQVILKAIMWRTKLIRFTGLIEKVSMKKLGNYTTPIW